MAHVIISLTESTVAAVHTDADDAVHVRLAPAILIRSQGIAGVDASTRWAQEGVLTIQEAQVSGPLPGMPALTTGGSMECGGLKYLDMVPLPLAELPGFAELRLRLPAGEVVVTGQDPRFLAGGDAQYLGHIRETQPAG